MVYLPGDHVECIFINNSFWNKDTSENFTVIGLIFGTFGTAIGGFLGISFKKISNKFLSFVLALASGLMIAIVSFDLVPEALNISGVSIVILGIILGIISMILCDVYVKNKMHVTNINTLLQTGIIISIGLALHNIPEGLAIGTGCESSIKLGFSLAISIAIHDIPEGISMAAPMKKGGMKASKILLYVFLSGVTTGIGAFIGAIIGNISEQIIAVCLAFAAGAMLYIISGELTPEYNKIYNGKISTIGNIIGFLLGFIATNL